MTMIKHALAAAAFIAAMLLLGALADAAGVSVTPEDAIKRALQGGCALVTHEYLIARLKAAYEAGKREEACRPTI